MKRRITSFAISCSIFALVSVASSPAATPQPGSHRATRLASIVFGVPFPSSKDEEAWKRWHQRVFARLAPRRAAGVHANGASGGSASPIETIAGSVPYQGSYTPTTYGIGDGFATVEDTHGNVYIATGSLGVVLKVDSSGTTSVYAGQPLPTGPRTPSGDSGPATSARLLFPSGLALDSADNLYIADPPANSVSRVDAGTGKITTVAGTPNVPGYSGDAGPATSALLESPYGLVISNQSLFIADGSSVREVNLNTGIIQTVAGGNFSSNFCTLTTLTSSCPATKFPINLSVGPRSIAVEGNVLYMLTLVVDPINGASSGPVPGMVKVDLGSGMATFVVAQNPYSGGTTTDVIQGQAVAAASGQLLVSRGKAFYGSDDIYLYSPSDGTYSAIVQSDPQFNDLESISIAPDGSILAIDLGTVVSLSADGKSRRVIAGNGSDNFFGDGVPALKAGTALPEDVAIDPDGNLFIADTENLVVRKVNGQTGVITTVAGNGIYEGDEGEGRRATDASLVPQAVVTDKDGNLYIVDVNLAAIKKVDHDTGVLTTLLLSEPSGPIVYDGDKTLYFTEFGVVAKVDITTGVDQVVAGDGTQNFSGDGGPALQAGIGYPQGVALDGKGNLYISDGLNNAIRKVNLASGIIETIAGRPSGEPGYSGDGGPASAATLSGPGRLTCDKDNHLLISDTNNSVIRKIDLASGTITTVAGNGTFGFSGDGGAAGLASLFFPAGLAVDVLGNLIVTDAYNDRIRRVIFERPGFGPRLSVSSTAISAGDSVTLTMKSTALSFGFAPTGTATFLNGTTTLGTAEFAPANDGSGQYVATLTTDALPAGTASITGRYDGDMHYASVAIPPVAITVSAPAPSYTLGASPSSLTIKQGSSGSITFTITPKNGFNQPVSFGCDSTTLPKGVTCNFSPASVTPTDGKAVTTTLTVRTTSASVAALDTPGMLLSGWVPGGGAALALILLGLPRIRRNAWLSGGVCLLVLCLAGTALGCGGGDSGTSGGGTQNANATPPGTYSISITASAGTGSAAVSQPLAVAITVTQ